VLQRVAKSIQKKQATDPASLSEKDHEFLNFFSESHSNINEANAAALLDYVHGL